MPDGAASRPPVVSGIVRERLPRALYRVVTGAGTSVIAHVRAGAGRNFVRLVVGDRVTVELSAHDAGRGRILRREQAG